MELKLTKRPKNPTIIEGFPGFGLVGTIATEFLMDHLDFEPIGQVWMEEMQPIAAIHEGKVVEPLGLFYNKKYNLMIIHGITAVENMEWKIADIVLDIAKQLNAKEMISLEGVASPTMNEEPKSFFFSNDKTNKKRWEKVTKELKEGIIVGVTGAIILRAKKQKISCIFADTHSKLPDSKAAAKVVEVLDKYLGLKIDYKPLLKQAEQFEEKLKGLLSKSHKVTEEQLKKKMSYVG